MIVFVLAQHLWNGPAIILGVYSSLDAAQAAAARGVHDLQEQLIDSEDWEWADDDEEIVRPHWFAEAGECLYTIEEFLVEPAAQPPLQA